LDRSYMHDRKIIIKVFFLILLILPLHLIAAEDLQKRLEGIPNITIKSIEADSGFTRAFEISMQQPLDHQNPDGIKFNQKILLSHRGIDKPVVLITEGYSLRTNYTRELSHILDANELRVEYRFFGDSKPDSLIWTYLTVGQAVQDYHRIASAFKTVYKNKWISTGWSKGGQTAVFYRYYYPNDAAVTAAYDAPFNIEREEKRIDQFFLQVGTKDCRERLFNFQKTALQRKNDVLPFLRDYAQVKKYSFSIGLEAAYEYIVLEYPFSFWQYHKINCAEIPDENAFPQEIFEHLKKVVSFSSYSDRALNSASMYQFYTEHGYYGYVKSGLEKWLSGAYGYSNALFAPMRGRLKFSSEMITKILEWQETEAENILYIYGENDPWSAPAVNLKKNSKCIKAVVPQGNHFSFINSFKEKERRQIINTLRKWLESSNAED